MIVDHRIAGPRITVCDVLHHLENDWPTNEIEEVLGLSNEQVRAAVEYIDAHRDEVMRVHQRIKERNARGNPPDVQARLEAARARRSAWLEQQHKTVTR
jgi:uncharacterized protein (DUF433 family)